MHPSKLLFWEYYFCFTWIARYIINSTFRQTHAIWTISNSTFEYIFTYFSAGFECVCLQSYTHSAKQRHIERVTSVRATLHVPFLIKKQQQTKLHEHVCASAHDNSKWKSNRHSTLSIECEVCMERFFIGMRHCSVCVTLPPPPSSHARMDDWRRIEIFTFFFTFCFSPFGCRVYELCVSNQYFFTENTYLFPIRVVWVCLCVRSQFIWTAFFFIRSMQNDDWVSWIVREVDEQFSRLRKINAINNWRDRNARDKSE